MSAAIDLLTKSAPVNQFAKSLPGSEIRIIGRILPFIAARLEHRPICPSCEGAGRFTRRGRKGVEWIPCETCDSEGYGPEIEDCTCRDCERLQHVTQPGLDADLRGMGEPDEAAVVMERVEASLSGVA